ncbi:MAG: DUF4293 domain-containing protein [Dysgonamonadaceae bacterium]|jgi:uncharacterized membrane protein (UPF0136 family)|nr:DUF4293 domain-containing protein [Dysgonamonadaceae bacterium]
MIQRIQSVYLLLISGLMLAVSFLPAASLGREGDVVVMRLSVECISTAVLALVALFLYKNRKQQLTICFVILGILALSYLIILFDLWLPSHNIIEFKPAIVFPLFAIILDALAIFAIQKDEKLVHSADRLR